MAKKTAKRTNKPEQTTKAIVMSEAMKKDSAAGNVRSVSINIFGAYKRSVYIDL